MKTTFMSVLVVLAGLITIAWMVVVLDEATK